MINVITIDTQKDTVKFEAFKSEDDYNPQVDNFPATSSEGNIFVLASSKYLLEFHGLTGKDNNSSI